MKTKTKTLKILLAAVAVFGLAGFVPQPALAAGDDPVELVLGTDGSKSVLFAMGNGIATALALNVQAVSVYNYATKGGKDNLKRITKKKRAINLAAVMLKTLEKSKSRGKVLALMTLGSTGKKPDWVALVIRPKPPKGVSSKKYDAAIYALVRGLYSEKSGKLIKKQWKRWAPNRNSAIFKNAGVAYHPAALRAFKDLGLK